jgi:hypothetical protein
VGFTGYVTTKKKQADKYTQETTKINEENRTGKTVFFYNIPLLFAICINTFSKLV